MRYKESKSKWYIFVKISYERHVYRTRERCVDLLVLLNDELDAGFEIYSALTEEREEHGEIEQNERVESPDGLF